MGESEARTVTYSPTHKPIPATQHQVSGLKVDLFGAPAPSKAKRRRHKPETARLYARLREVPRNVPLEKAAQMYDRKQIPFPVPKHLRDRGWPDSWVKTWKDTGFRRKFHDLRQHAWQAKPKN